MLKKDLTTSYPRSVRAELLGVTQLARALDKGIAAANDTLGEYVWDCPMDRKLFAFLDVDGEKLFTVIKSANSEDEILAFVKPNVDAKPADEIRAFNASMVELKPQPGSEGETYFLGLRNQVAPNRTDVTTWADLLDLDEKRDVPQRVAA